jgi:hypothetical protein
MKQSSAFLIDGSALFYTSRTVGDSRPLNYRRFGDHIRSESGVEQIELTRFYTAFDPANDAQGKFLGFIEHEMGWELEAIPVNEAIVTPPTFITYQHNEPRPFIRFDSAIAFALGRVAGTFGKVVVVTDSYGLARPIMQTMARGTAVTLAFFRQCLDPRWNKLLREVTPANKRTRSQDRVDFVDLDTAVDDLFGLGVRVHDTLSISKKSRLP